MKQSKIFGSCSAVLLLAISLAACKKDLDVLAEQLAFDATCDSTPFFRESASICRRPAFDPTKVCTTITGGGTSSAFNASGCVACSAEGAAMAIDNNFETGAKVSLPPSAAALGQPGFRAIAQKGTIYPAGSTVGIVLSNGQTQAGLQAQTYLDGVLQESAGGSTQVFKEGGLVTVAYKTSKDFDAVELKMTAAKPDGSENLDILEFCSNTRVP